ncbi:MAG: GEVED domain-containing protein, partial [Planctomycetota bacterium]|nr:GEVED domain-containing protein [Planctomycetota bacterium]
EFTYGAGTLDLNFTTQTLTFIERLKTNNIDVVLVDPLAADQLLSIAVVDDGMGLVTMTINLATDNLGAILTTTNEIVAAIQADAIANALVSVSATGSEVVTVANGRIGDTKARKSNNSITTSDVDAFLGLGGGVFGIGDGVLQVTLVSAEPYEEFNAGPGTLRLIENVPTTDDIQVQVVFVAGANTPESVAVTGVGSGTAVVTVTLGTDGGGAIISTLGSVEALIEGDVSIDGAGQHLKVEIIGTDTDLVTAPGNVTIDSSSPLTTDNQLTLSRITGLVFAEGDGTDDMRMRFTGSIKDINAALEGMIFTPTQHDTGGTQFEIKSEDQGNFGPPKLPAPNYQNDPKFKHDIVTVTLVAVNDAPEIQYPANTQLYGYEDQNIFFSLGANSLAYTFGVETLTVVQRDAQGTPHTLELLDPGAVNSPLAVSLSGTDILVVLGTDGAGAIVSTSDEIAAAINAHTSVSPIVYAHSTGAAVASAQPQTTIFDSAVDGLWSLYNSGGVFDADFTFGDFDPNVDEFSVTVTVTSGTLTLAGTSGLTYSSGANGTNSMVFTGTPVDISAAFDSAFFRNDPEHFNTPADGLGQISILVNDQGTLGLGGPLFDTLNLSVNVLPVNDAPVNEIHAGAPLVKIAGSEDFPLVFSLGAATLDIPFGAETLRFRERLKSDVITVNLVDPGAANQPLSVVVTGVGTGAATLTINLATDAGGLVTSTLTNITDAIRKNATANSLVHSYFTANVVATAASGTLSGRTAAVTDVDAQEGVDNLSISLSSTFGTLTLGDTTNVTNLVGDGTGNVSFEGSLAAIDAALTAMTFTVNIPDATGDMTIIMVTNDLGNFPTPARETTDTITIDVIGHNDEPVVEVPNYPLIAEQQRALVILHDPTDSDPQGFQFTDTDALGTDTIEVTLSSPNGTFTIPTPGPVSVDNSDPSAIVLTGTLDNVNSALRDVRFISIAGFWGTTTITIFGDDLGNTGVGGAETDSKTVDVEVIRVDFGDALGAGYGTVRPALVTSPDLSARHEIDSTIYLGTGVDADLDGQPNADATGDNTLDGNDDEDGVVLTTRLQVHQTQPVTSRFEITASVAGFVGIWIDLDNNGTFDADEFLDGSAAVGGSVMAVSAGVNAVNVVIPAVMPGGHVVADLVGNRFARVRFSTSAIDAGAPTGFASDGEVEDYQFLVEQVAAPVPVVFTRPPVETTNLGPTIGWGHNTANVRYSLQLFNALSPTAILTTDAIISGSSASVKISDHLPNLSLGNYTAQVTAYNAVNLPSSTQTRNFKVVDLRINSPVTVSGQLIDETPTFNWSDETSTTIDGGHVFTLSIHVRNSDGTLGAQIPLVGAGPAVTTAHTYTVPTGLGAGKFRATIVATDPSGEVGVP